MDEAGGHTLAQSGESGIARIKIDRPERRHALGFEVGNPPAPLTIGRPRRADEADSNVQFIMKIPLRRRARRHRKPLAATIRRAPFR